MTVPLRAPRGNGVDAGGAIAGRRAIGQRDGRLLRRAALGLFCVQLAALDLALRGAAFYAIHPRAVFHLAASAALLFLVASLRPGRAGRAVFAALFGASVALQVAFFRYYHAPLDDQAAVAARLAWADVRAIVAAGLPAAIALTLVIAAIEHAWLGFVAGGADGAPRARRTGRRVAAVGLAAALLAGGPLRHGTTEIRTADAATSFALASPPAAQASRRALPPLASRRARVPSVLFVVTESVRASDHCGDAAEPCEVAPEIAALLPDRVALRQMRATSAYTAISMSAILTGLTQVGPRDRIAAAPDLFDLARAVRADGRPLGVHYWSAHSPSFFERADPAGAVDTFVSADTLAGRVIDDVEDAVAGGFDRRLAAECEARLPGLATPFLAMVHFSGTHAPYFVDDARAPFRPYSHTPSWAGMEDLHRAYRNAIFEQDRSIAACARAFLAAQRGGPYVIVFTSDHGEEFGEHRAIHHGQDLYDEQIHVPAFVAAGGGALSEGEAEALAASRDAPLTHFDLLPTILDALGVLDHFALAADRGNLAGRSLLRPAPPSPPVLPITNCSGMWQCPINAWGLLAGDRKLTAQAWDGEWRCLRLAGGEREVPLGGCADLVAASRAVFRTKPNGASNE